MITIITRRDEHNKTAVIIKARGEQRIYTRCASSHTAEVIAATLSSDIARHEFAAIEGYFDELPVAEFRMTKAGKSLLIAATVQRVA